MSVYSVAQVRGPVLITGGAGFIGRYLAKALKDGGLDVTVLDDLSCANSTFDCPQLATPGITCIEGSVFDRQLVEDLVAEHATVVHFASVVGVQETISRPVETVENLEGTLNIARALTASHVVLFGSSADVYAAHSHLYDRPMREDDHLLMEHPQVNRWVYAHVKALEENVIANTPARSIVIRVFNTYGPAMDYPHAKRVVPHFIDAILNKAPLKLSGDGSQTRSFCYVEDTVAGMIQSLAYATGKQGPFTDCFNLGASNPMSMRDLAEAMVAMAVEVGLLAAPLPIVSDSFTYTQKFDDSWNRVPDISHAREVLGFAPHTPFADGLRLTLEHYLDVGQQRQAAAG